MIAFKCPMCGSQLRVVEAMGGKRGTCPGCQCKLQVPPATQPATRDSTSPGPKKAKPTTGLKTKPAAAPPTDTVSAPVAKGAPAAKSAGVPEEEYAFLSPPQGPGELGRLGPYRVLKVLGTGGMGVVFQAEDVNLKRMVALKAMKPTVATETNRQRFLREARLAASLEHDHIVTIYQVGEDEERNVPYLAMKLLQGEPLDQKLGRMGGRLPAAEALRIGREVAEGLQVAHDHGLVHRDIKPANIWLETTDATGGYRVKIVDFGLAREADEDIKITKTGSVMGTPAYMAPEQANGEAVDGRTDLFSLGAVLYHLCTGQLPFKGNDTLSMLMALATQNPEPPRRIDAALPSAVSDFILKLLAKKPGDRPQTARAVVEAIQGLERLPLPKSAGRPAAGSINPNWLETMKDMEAPADANDDDPYHVSLGELNLSTLLGDEEKATQEDDDPLFAHVPEDGEEVPRIRKAASMPYRPAPSASEVEPAEQRGGEKSWEKRVILGSVAVGGLLLALIIFLLIVRNNNPPETTAPQGGRAALPTDRLPLPAPEQTSTSPPGDTDVKPEPKPTPQAPRAMDELAKALSSINQKVRLDAIAELEKRGPEAAVAIPQLADALKDRDGRVQVAIAALLARLGPPARVAYPALERVAQEPDDKVQRAVQEALQKIGRPTPADVLLFVDALKAANASFRADAVAALLDIHKQAKGSAPELKKAVPALADALRDSDPRVRVRAAQALWAIDRRDESAVPVLVVAMSELGDDDNRVQAMRIVAEIGPKASPAVPALHDVLKKGDTRLRAEAAMALAEMGPEAKAAFATLIGAARDTNPAVSDPSKKTLAKLARTCPWTKTDLPPVLEAFSEKDPEIQAAALVILRRLGPDGVAPFAAGLADKKPEVRLATIGTLAKIGGAPAAAALMPCLRDKTRAVRARAAEVMGDLGPLARDAVPDLIEILKEEYPTARAAAVKALVKIGKASVPELVKTLKNTDNAAVRSDVIKTLGQLGPDAKDAVATLKELQPTLDSNMQLEVKDALNKIQK